MDTFTTIRSEAHIEFTEKKSVFMGHAFPVPDEDSCLLYIDEMRSRYADATHNVYAYVLRQNNLMRYSDAGEPQGTAGMPTLDVLRKKGITDALVVVTAISAAFCWGQAVWSAPIPRPLPTLLRPRAWC